jgi:hypothetical protein
MITGECFCGAIKYRYGGELNNARSCHCSRCRKAFSGPSSAYAEVDNNKFQWVCGREFLTHYSSNEEWGKSFCGKCGSTLCGTHNGEVHGVALGCLNGQPDVVLRHHLFVGSKANWEELPQGKVKQYEEYSK